MTSALRWAAMRAILMFHNCEGQSHKTVLTDHNFWRERRAEADSNRGPSAYQPNAIPIGQTASLYFYFLAVPFHTTIIDLDLIWRSQQHLLTDSQKNPKELKQSWQVLIQSSSDFVWVISQHVLKGDNWYISWWQILLLAVSQTLSSHFLDTGTVDGCNLILRPQKH